MGLTESSYPAVVFRMHGGQAAALESDEPKHFSIKCVFAVARLRGPAVSSSRPGVQSSPQWKGTVSNESWKAMRVDLEQCHKTLSPHAIK